MGGHRDRSIPLVGGRGRTDGQRARPTHHATSDNGYIVNTSLPTSVGCGTLHPHVVQDIEI